MLELIELIMIELAFLEELMLIKQVHQKNVIFVTIGIFWIKVCLQRMSLFINEYFESKKL